MNPPVEPALEDCCRSGCCPCVFDLYAEALERYEAWLAAQPANAPPVAPAQAGVQFLAEQPKPQMGFPPARE